jgi:hypothetical protein
VSGVAAEAEQGRRQKGGGERGEPARREWDRGAQMFWV